MPDSFDHLPEHWTRMATEARAAAATLRDPFAKRELLLIAQRYELLAARTAGRFEVVQDKRTA